MRRKSARLKAERAERRRQQLAEEEQRRDKLRRLHVSLRPPSGGSSSAGYSDAFESESSSDTCTEAEPGSAAVESPEGTDDADKENDAFVAPPPPTAAAVASQVRRLGEVALQAEVSLATALRRHAAGRASEVRTAVPIVGGATAQEGYEQGGPAVLDSDGEQSDAAGDEGGGACRGPVPGRLLLGNLARGGAAAAAVDGDSDQAGRRDRDTTVGRRSTFTRRSTYNRKSMFSSRNSTYSGDATSRSRRSLLPWRLRHPSLQRQPTGTSLMGSDGRPVTPPSNMKRPTGAPVASGQASTKPKPAGTVKFTDFAASLEESTINRESSAMTEDSALPSAATPGWPMAGIAEAPSEDEKVDIETSGSSPHTA